MLQLDYKQDGNKQVFTLVGKLDQMSFNQLDVFIEQNYIKKLNVHLNLNKLEYVSSIGLRSFISLAKLVYADQKKITVSALEGSMVRQIIFISGFSKLMPFVDD